MQKTVRAPGLRKPLLLHGIHDIYGRLCIIGNTISILRQMHGDLMAVAAPSLEAKRKRKKKKRKRYEDSPLEENIESSGGSSLFFLSFFHLLLALPFAISHCIRSKELFERRTTAKPPDEPDSSPRPSRSDGGEKRPSLSRTVANGLRDADLRTAV